jgi:prephenate dehydrogenase
VNKVLVVGCGLIGTSIGLALSGADDVLLLDTSADVQAAAVRRGAGRPWDQVEHVALAVVAVPPARTAHELRRLQSLGVATTYTHVASVQSHVQHEVEALNCDLSTIVGGHPLAGREISGPPGARADLFVGRPWAVCPTAASRSEAVSAVRELVAACGALPVTVSAGEHDAAVALLSHLPQVTASALAGLLVQGGASGQEGSHRSVTSLGLSGPGLADTTRLAASDPALWSEILRLNAPRVAPVVKALVEELLELHHALEVLAHEAGEDEAGEDSGADRSSRGSEPYSEAQRAATAAVKGFLRRGNLGRALVPVKRGGLSESFVSVGVVVEDVPGGLARLFVAVEGVGVNVEDVRVEHLPGRPTGVIELLVASDAAASLRAALGEGGWRLSDL